MQGKICLVTSATSGIGNATALELAKQGHTVLVVARNQTRGNDAKQAIIKDLGHSAVDVVLADLSSQQSIRALAQYIKANYPRLDVLINNAAVYTASRTVTTDGLELMFATNHIAYFLLTTLLLDHLHLSDAGRILNVTAPSTSKLNFDDLQGVQRFNALSAFGASKMCNLLFTFALAKHLEETTVTVNAVHPGLVRSRLLKDANVVIRTLSRLVSRPPEQAGRQIAELATSPQFAGKNGRFYRAGQEIKYSPYAADSTNQDKLWTISEQLTQA